MGQPNNAPPAQPTTPPAPGAMPPADPPPTTGPAVPPATGDTPLGEAGQKALEAERAARKELEKQVKELEPLKALQGLAAALGVKPDQGKTDVQTLTDQVAAMQKQLVDERAGRLRAEVAAEKKLPPALAARLQGATREELAADADALAVLFPAGGAAGTPGAPAPDPSQGARGGVDTLQAALAEAQKAKNTAEVIRLKTALHAAQNPK